MRNWSVRKMFAKLDLMEKLRPKQSGDPESMDTSGEMTEEQVRMWAASGGVNVRDRHGGK